MSESSLAVILIIAILAIVNFLFLRMTKLDETDKGNIKNTEQSDTDTTESIDELLVNDKLLDSDDEELRSEARFNLIIPAIDSAVECMDFVTTNFEEFSELKKGREEVFMARFIHFHVAMIIIAERGNKSLDELNQIAYDIFMDAIMLQELGFNHTETFTYSKKKQFFDGVREHLNVITSYISNNLDLGSDSNPGFNLVKELISSSKGELNITNEELNKCLSLAKTINDLTVNYIAVRSRDVFEKEKQIPSESLSRRLDDVADDCGVSIEEFHHYYLAYINTLQGKSNWNEDIDSMALDSKVLTEDEVKLAKLNKKQAAFNRTIFRFKYLQEQ